MSCSSAAHRALVGGLFALFFLCFAVGGARAEVAARTDFVHGLITATEAGRAERTLLKGAEVFDRDQINTAQGARAQLRFSDGGLVSLLPNTTFSVEEYRLGDAGGEDGSLVFGLLRGGLRTVTGAIGKSHPDNYQLKTPVGTLGIRGTEFIAVIDPPGTLRVHVGRGKVVLTNPYGTLEVPEGYNAIMTLTEAPRLTEQGPVYMATGPQGDLRIPEGMVRSDPYNLDLPLFTTLAAASEPFLVSGSGYYMALGDGGANTVDGFGDAVFSTSTGTLISFLNPLNPYGIDLGGPGAATTLAQSTVGGLNWGVLGNGNILINGNTVNLSPTGPPLPYIIGLGATTPLAGQLSFNLPAGVTPPVYSSSGNVGTLNQFGLDIDIASLDFTLNMNLVMGGNGYSAAHTGGPGSFSYSGADPSFGFNSVPVIATGSGCASGCILNAQGFFTSGGNAGVAYVVTGDAGGNMSGVAPLVPPNYTPPTSGAGGGGANMGI